MKLFESKSDFAKVVVWTSVGVGMASVFAALNGVAWVRQISEDTVKTEVSFEIDRLRYELEQSRNLLPSGAVLAFATERGCPDGWREFELGVGRVIVGAGQAPTSPATSFPILSTGGEEVTQLAVENLPSGAVGEIETTRIRGVIANEGSQFSAVDDVKTVRIGRGQPTNNMQPYVALQYCQRD